MFPRRRLLSLCAATLILGICPLMAASITYTISGTLGAALSGSDPLGASGGSGIVTAVVGTTLVRTSKTKTSATYTLAAGAVTVVIGGKTYPASSSTLKYSFPPAGPDTMVFTATVSVDHIKGTVVGTASLAKGSLTAAVTKHPHKFTPSPQTLTAAVVAGGPGTQIEYTALGSSTVLGLSGSASN
jgi:hypothetical protein